MTMVLIGSLTLTAGTWLNRSTNSIQATTERLHNYSSSRIHAALNDLTRLAISLPWSSERGLEADLTADEFAMALNLLSARADHMESRLSEIGELAVGVDEGVFREALEESGRRAIVALRRLVDVGDVVVVKPDIPEALVASSYRNQVEAARSATFRYLDHVIKLEDRLTVVQTAKIQSLTRTSYLFLAVITIIVGVSMKLLRMEVIARTEREQAENRAHKLAFFDPVTGLFNRISFRDHVERSLAEKKKGALVIIDLDGFKDINDRHGHAVGDDVLKIQASRIRAETESNRGIAARLGGDEFAVFLETDNVAFLKNFCQALVEEGARSINIGTLRIHPKLSVGLATTTQLSVARTVDFGDLLRVADFALYNSKSSGKGRFTLYDADLEAVYSERNAMQEALPKAIRNGELSVFFQPKVCLSTHEVKGFEALVRWHRDGVIVPPGEFIEIAEETGRVVELDRFVLEETAKILSNWNRDHKTNFAVSVNLSGLHFKAENGLDFVRPALEAYNLAPQLMTLEITETVQLANWQKVERDVAALRELGCRVSIDDFGSGYSSLAYLRTITADELKIDRSLLLEIDTSHEAQFILDAVLDVARSLSLEVVVEGIERPAQADLVRQLGCDTGQGYLFGKPSPAEEALAEATRALNDLQNSPMRMFRERFG